MLIKQPNSLQCFVCGIQNPYGLKLKFYQTSPDEVTVNYTVADHYQGYPGVVHGGIVASMLDEVAGRALMGADPLNPRFMFTARLDVQYREPVPIKTPLQLIGRVVKRKNRSRPRCHLPSRWQTAGRGGCDPGGRAARFNLNRRAGSIGLASLPG